MTSVTILTKAMQAVSKKYKGTEVSKVAMLECTSRKGNIESASVLVEFKEFSVVIDNNVYYELYADVTKDNVTLSEPKEC